MSLKYQETDEVRRKRENAFTYHPPKSDQPERYNSLRLAASSLSAKFNLTCPQSRELALAQTKLEEAVFWANAAIARNE